MLNKRSGSFHLLTLAGLDSDPLSTRLKYLPGEEPLLYAGGSYGTDLGQVFASMQPHRVKRMFLDAVDSTEASLSGARTQSLVNADEIMDHCFEYCALARDKCALYNGPTAQDTRDRMFAILRDLKENGPVFVPRHGDVDGNVVTLSDVFQHAYLTLYEPLISFESFANAMGPLSQRNGTAFVDIYKSRATPIFQSSTYESPGVPINASDPGTNTHPWATFYQLENAIACPESWIRRNKTEYKKLWKYYEEQSFWGGRLWATEYVRSASRYQAQIRKHHTC